MYSRVHSETEEGGEWPLGQRPKQVATCNKLFGWQTFRKEGSHIENGGNIIKLFKLGVLIKYMNDALI